MLVGWRRKNGLLKTGDKASSEEKPVQLHNTYMYIVLSKTVTYLYSNTSHSLIITILFSSNRINQPPARGGAGTG